MKIHRQKTQTCTTENPGEVCEKPVVVTNVVSEVELPKEFTTEYEMPEEFRVSGPLPPILSNLFPLSTSMEEDVFLTTEDMCYVSTLCPSPPSVVDNLTYQMTTFDDIFLETSMIGVVCCVRYG
uniref:Uncharacterized protein n=1 Tax=Oryza brachyantha TaxID=4533 RepID=J3MJL5_ORYBR